MSLYTFLRNLPNVIVQIANKMGLQEKDEQNRSAADKKEERRTQIRRKETQTRSTQI
jgi:hypothetical protein